MSSYCLATDTTAVVNVNGSTVATLTSNFPLNANLQQLPSTVSWETDPNTTYNVIIQYTYRENWFPPDLYYLSERTIQIRGKFSNPYIIGTEPYRVYMDYLLGTNQVISSNIVVAYVAYVILSNPTIVSVQNQSNGAILTPVAIPSVWELDITDSTGANVFSQQYPNQPSFNISCSACPPNTLDCGNCCLDCANTYNQLSGVLKTLNNLS